jgi:hypothetical protein
VSILAGGHYIGYADGPASSNAFSAPHGIAFLPDGDLLVADADNHCIRLVSALNGTASTFAGMCGVSGYADGPATAASFWVPWGVTYDPWTGDVIVADTYNSLIRRIAAGSRAVSTVAGDRTRAFADGFGTAAKFSSPRATAINAAGTIFVADCVNNRIRAISAAGEVSTFAGGLPPPAGMANPEHFAQDGVGTAAAFYWPSGMVLDPVSNTLIVADQNTYLIRRVAMDGTVTTIAGTNYNRGVVDSPFATAAAFAWPLDVGIDSAGNIYVADYGGYAVRRIAPGGAVTTVVSGANTFRSLEALSVAADGTVYVSDTSGYAVRVIT